MSDQETSPDETRPPAAAPTPPPEEGETIERIVERLGPFAPPPDFRFEPEFDPPVPRPIPAELRKGPYEQERIGQLTFVVGLGLFFVLFSSARPMRELSLYFPALDYGRWIGASILGVGGLGLLWYLLAPDRFRYVRRGLPLAARVLGIAHYSYGRTRRPRFGCRVLVDLPHPETGQPFHYWLNNDPLGWLKQDLWFGCDINQGDYLTMVYLPGKFPNSLRVYSLLGLNPMHAPVTLDGRRYTGKPPVLAMLRALGSTALVLLCVFFALYALDICIPFEEYADELLGPALVCVAGGAALGLAIAAWLKYGRKRKDAKLIPGSIIGLCFGFLFALFALIPLNALLDRSQPEYRDVSVIGFRMEGQLFRLHQIVVQELDGLEIRKLSTLATEIRNFGLTRAGLLKVKRGFFGARWADGVLPVTIVSVDVGRDKTHARLVEIHYIKKNETETIVADLKVKLENGQLMDVSDRLRETVWKRLEKEGVNDGEVTIRVLPYEEKGAPRARGGVGRT